MKWWNHTANDCDSRVLVVVSFAVFSRWALLGISRLGRLSPVPCLGSGWISRLSASKYGLNVCQKKVQPSFWVVSWKRLDYSMQRWNKAKGSPLGTSTNDFLNDLRQDFWRIHQACGFEEDIVKTNNINRLSINTWFYLPVYSATRTTTFFFFFFSHRECFVILVFVRGVEYLTPRFISQPVCIVWASHI